MKISLTTEENFIFFFFFFLPCETKKFHVIIIIINMWYPSDKKDEKQKRIKAKIRYKFSDAMYPKVSSLKGI